MANKVKIYSELKSGKVSFDGSRVSNKEIGSLEVEAHPSISNRIIISSNRVFKRGSATEYRIFFGKLNINRIQNEAGQNLVADLGMDRDAVIAYIVSQITKPIVTEYFEYNPVTDRLEANKNIEVKKHGFFIGGKYKMASGNSNLYYEDLSDKANSYPVMGKVLDQSLAENQAAGAGFETPKMRVFGDFQAIPLGGTPVDDTSIAYDGLNFFPFNISGVGITTRIAEVVMATQRLKYEITIDDLSVYIQYLDHSGLAVNEDLTWYFDHPLDIETGTTLRATIYKVSTVDNQEVIDGVLNVCEGSATPTRYATTVLNRFFEDKDLELISPYTKYQAMDFGLDPTGSTILLRDLSLGTDSFLQPHAVNTLEAVANGSTIKIKLKDGAKVIVDSLPVSGTSIDGAFVNSVMNQAVIQLNEIFTNTSGFISPDTFVSSFTLSGNDLTLGLNDGVSYTVDVTTLGVDENNFVSTGSLSGNNLTLTMADASVVTIDVTALALDEDISVVSGVVSGTDIVLTMSDATEVTIAASALGGSSSSGNPVVSGSVIGTDLVLVLDDATQITIDASNMVNGSSGLASGGANWFISYGSLANTAVNHPQTNVVAGVGGNAPFHFGTPLTRGSEMKWNHTLVNKQSVFGIWAGTEAVAGTYNSRIYSYNWSTAFKWLGAGFVDFNTNMDLITANNTASAYTPIQGSEMILRFGTDGHLSLINVVAGAEVLVMKTTIALSVTEFNLQMGSDQNQNFPVAQVVDIESLWEIVHDYNNVEGGIDNGILDHTIIKSAISIEKGEKIMFMLDEVGQGDYFGTNYTAAATGVLTAEEQLDNTFIYQTNEAIVLSTALGVSDWTPNTSAAGYFFAANLHQYRVGGAGTIQGMFSLRFNTNGTLSIHDEDAGERVATATMDPAVDSSVHLHFGVKGNRAYYSIPVISKQSLSQSNQPDSNYVPVVADQTASVEEGEVLNFQVVSSDNIVNQFVEVDAPSWMTMNQNSGVLSGTAPAFSGTAADTIVVTCKAGNAIGGSVDFTVTISVTEDTSYTNSKSLSFNGTSSYLNGNATLMDSMDRAANGDGNAWSISMWVKPNNNTATQTLFVYGNGDDVNGGAITIKKLNANNIYITYGSTTENIALFGNAFTHGNWSHVMVTFDGGTTGNTAADVNDYYSRFNVYVNGVSASIIGGSSGSGYTGIISGENTSDNVFRFGRANNVYNNYFDGSMNQMAIWSSDESANIADIYNSGATQDLSLLTSAPDHYYEIETSATTVSDIEGSANLTGYNFASSDLVTDTP